MVLVEIGLELRDYFENVSAEDWENLLQKDKGRWTWRLEKNLSLLAGTDSWGVLQELAQSWRTQLTTSILPVYLQPAYEFARQQAHERNFDEAYRIAEIGCQQIPNAFVEQLPPEIGEQGLWRLRDVLQARLLIEKKIIAAAKELKKTAGTLKQAFSGIELNIGEHPDVPYDDLVSLLNDLKLGIEIESLLQKRSSVDSYASDINSYQEFANLELAIKVRPPEFIQRFDPQLARELQEFIISLQEELALKTNDAILAMSNRIHMETQFIWPASDPASLLALTWQLRWCLISTVTSELKVVATAREALARAQQGPRLLLNQALLAFNSMRKYTDLVYLGDILKALTKLNNGLSQIILDGSPVIILPPIPDGRSLPAPPLELDDGALDAWGRIVKSWAQVLSGAIEFSDTPKYEPTVVKKIGEQDQELRRDLNKLKKEVWPKLQLPPWTEGSMEDRLDKELNFCLKQVNALQKAGSCLVYKGAIECLEHLDELMLLMEQTDPYRPSILDAQSQYLRIGQKDLRHQAQEKLKSQLTNILQDQTKPAEKLRREILLRPQSKKTAQFVYHSVLDSANRLSSETPRSGGRDQRNLYWEIISAATEPWANSEGVPKNNSQLSPEIIAQWQELHQSARKAADRKLPRIELKRANGVIVALVLVIFVAWFGSKAWASRSREQNLLVFHAVDATTTQMFSATRTFQAAEAVQKTARSATITVEAYLLATRQSATAQSSAATETALAQENAQATAIRLTSEATTPTAPILALGAQLETKSALCKDPTQYTLEIMGQPVLYPVAGTHYVIGNAPFDATATWEIKNTGNCNWTNLLINPQPDLQPIPFTFFRDGAAVEITPEQPLNTGEQIEVKLDFGVLESANITQEWFLVANNLELSDQPHLQLKVTDWIILVTPRPAPTQELSNPNPPKPLSTPKPPSRKSTPETPPPR